MGQYRFAWEVDRADGRLRFGVRWPRLDANGQRTRTAGGHWSYETAWYPNAELRRGALLDKQRELNSGDGPRSVSWATLLDRFDAHLALAKRDHRKIMEQTLASFQLIARPQSAAIDASLCRMYFTQRAAGWVAKLARAVSDQRSAISKNEQQLPTTDRVYALTRGRPPSQSTLDKDWRYLSTFFSWCAAEELIRQNPMKRVPRPGTIEREQDPPAIETFFELLHAVASKSIELDDRQGWHVLLLLAYYIGERQTLLASTWTRKPPKGLTVEFNGKSTPPPWVEFCGAEAGGRALLHMPAESRKGKRRDKLKGVPAFVADRIAVRMSQMEGAGVTTGRLLPSLGRRFDYAAWERICGAAGVDLQFKSMRGSATTQIALDAAEGAAQRFADHSDAAVTRKHYLGRKLVALATAKEAPPAGLPGMPEYGGQGRRDRGTEGRRD